MNDVKHATHYLLDSVWTLGYKEVGEKVEIVSYDRDNPIGYEDRKSGKMLPSCKVIEDDKRTVRSVKIDDKTFDVSNPAFIFSYSG